MEKATGKVEEIFYIFAYRLSDSKLKGNWSQLWQNNAGHGKPLTLSLSLIHSPSFPGSGFYEAYSKFESLKLQTYVGKLILHAQISIPYNTIPRKISLQYMYILLMILPWP